VWRTGELAVTIQKFNLTLSSTGELIIPASISTAITTCTGTGAFVSVKFFDKDGTVEGVFETDYDERVARQVEIGKQVSQDFIDTLAALAK
jgi:hypothetical protein